MKKLILFALVTLQLINVAYTCSCVRNPSVHDEYNRSNAVFVGHVRQIETVDMEKRVLLYVTKAWKGIHSRFVRVRTCANSACCGFNFELHKSYLLYADKDQNNKLYVGLCSRSTSISDAADDITILNTLSDKSVVQQSGPIVSQKGTIKG